MNAVLIPGRPVVGMQVFKASASGAPGVSFATVAYWASYSPPTQWVVQVAATGVWVTQDPA